MPPQGNPRPENADLCGLISIWKPPSIAPRHMANPGRAHSPPEPLPNTATAIRDLLDLDIDVASLLPADDESDGFDNIAERAESLAVPAGTVSDGVGEGQ